MATVEYAKIVRIPTANSCKGFSTDIKLPSSFTFGSSGGFINFYVGFDDYECGISTASGQSGWRWFANSGAVEGTDAGGNFGDYANGQSVNIRLESILDPAGSGNYKVAFFVNNVRKHVFSPSFVATSNFANGRVVLGAAQQTWNANQVPATMPTWYIAHNQVTTSNTRYKNVNGTWVTLNASNSTPVTAHTPSNRTHPSPVDYTVSNASFSSGYYYASLNK
ncbi:hypothetical protein L2089_15915 [Paenibacillus hunanensis]|uniref:hypothetical protein n=1 Tax=Paenibacillus hunanensis TaxID=539262 RepID=UPI0020267704|nr:hypothetical protein [Paenibacillus hunanensis]MCL9662181.1 hypothetical protein [Paenibacillus hunanensis]